MGNAVTVVVPDDHAARLARIGEAAVWIDVAIVDDLAHAVEDRPVVVIGDPERTIDERVTYVIRAGTPDDQIQALLVAVATGNALAAPMPPSSPQSADDARRAKMAFTASRKLAAATDLLSTETIAIEAVMELLDVERAHCLFFDPDSASLWSEAKQRADGDDRRAIGGMVGWTARTGLPCAAVVAADDPRYVADIDDPDGDPATPILVQPIIGADNRVHAVLVASRRARRAPLGPSAAVTLARFAALAAPLLDQLSTHVEGQQLIETERGDASPLFREEAIEAAGPQQWGDVVRLAPRWLAWAYWILVVLLAGCVAFLWFGTVNTYSAGPAIVRSTARTSISTRTAGTISTVEVAPGDRVAAGAVIARLDDGGQRAAMERLDHELETALRNHMLDPADAGADASLRALRLQVSQARASLGEREIRATAAGTISDLRIRPGQHVEPGDVAASVVDGDGGLEVIALMPGEDRPQLAPGMALRLELTGYRYAYQAVMIDSVSPDVMAPAEARRVLGTDVAEGIQIGGPVVLVHGHLARHEFDDGDGRSFTYHDGMIGSAEVQVRTERILFALVPGMRRL